MPRFVKQLVFGVVYIVVILVIGYGIYYWLHPQPTCFDKIQNQNEEGVDCGLVCGNSCHIIMPLEVLSVKLFKVAEGDYDILTEIRNPNPDYGSSKIDYDLVLMGQSDEELNRQNYSFYILPGQTKHMVLNLANNNLNITRAQIEVKNIEWDKLNLFDPQLISFPVKNKQFNGVEFGAVVLNDSDFDFDTIDVAVILYDQNNNILGVNQSNINTLLSRTERYFKVLWPAPIEGVFRVDVEPSTNLLKNSNFLEKYGIQEKFQQYY